MFKHMTKLQPYNIITLNIEHLHSSAVELLSLPIRLYLQPYNQTYSHTINH